MPTHKLTVDWFRQIDITPDIALADKRWATAEKLAGKLTRTRVIELLRLYLFPPTRSEFTAQFTDDLIGLDAELFKATENIPELRLMAGLIMVTTFAGSSHEADAFALGIRAASFPQGRVQSIQPSIIAEGEDYLNAEAAGLRPDTFPDDSAEVTKILTTRRKAVSDAVAAPDEAKKIAAVDAYRKSVIETIADSHSRLARRVAQLAEESALVWWVLNEYSEALQKPVRELTPEAYAIAAASEAAKRTHLLPPPPNITPLLARALKSCQPGKERPVFADFVESLPAFCRSTLSQSLSVLDCRDLVPYCVAIEKTEELGDVSSAIKALAKLAPGVSGDLPVSPVQAARQFYNELVFLRALAMLPAV